MLRLQSEAQISYRTLLNITGYFVCSIFDHIRIRRIGLWRLLQSLADEKSPTRRQFPRDAESSIEYDLACSRNVRIRRTVAALRL